MQKQEQKQWGAGGGAACFEKKAVHKYACEDTMKKKYISRKVKTLTDFI